MRITVLVENTGPSEFKIEHGLSLYIEFNDKKYLLDDTILKSRQYK